MSEPSTLLESTEDLYVRYDAEPTADGKILVRRSVAKKARARQHRTVLADLDIALLTQDEAVELMRDLASSLRYSEPAS